MKHSEAKSLVSELAKAFPLQVLDGPAILAAKEFMKFEIPAVRSAIAEHRKTHDKVDWAELYQGCALAPEDRGSSDTWFEVYRRQAPYLRQAPDWELNLRIHRGWWHKSSKTEGYRRQLESSCRNLMLISGMNLESASRWTQTVFEEDPGYFQNCLEDLRNNIPAKACA